MKKKYLAGLASGVFLFGLAGVANAVIIDFSGGTATLSDSSTVVTTDTGLWNDTVASYIEDGIKVEFIGGYGTIGDYYNNSSLGGIGGYLNSVIHAHDFSTIDIRFSKVDGTTFDLNYVDMTSNTLTGGDLASGTEMSYITNNSGDSLLLAPSDWGVNYTFYGNVGDGIVRNWMNSDFDGILSFTISSENAYCFGMDNFYIDEPAPPAVPEPATMLLMGTGLAGLAAARRRKAKKN